MNGRGIFRVCGLAVLGIALVALSGPSAAAQNPTPAPVAPPAWEQPNDAEDMDVQVLALDEAEAKLDKAQEKVEALELMGEGGGWLGVKIQEVTAENVKELKLPAERGVLLADIVPDSPAAKAGLRAKDVVTEVNGQRVEGAAQFQRMIREIPPGRTVQVTILRDGKAQTINVTLGKAGEHGRVRAHPGPWPSGEFSFHMPNMPNVSPMPDFGHNVFFFAGPRIGIDAEDLDGQLGNYFGVPDGEGVLVREVKSGSPAEKAGLKAGDVVTKLDGERIRSVGDLREQLAKKHEQKSVTLGVLRNRSEISVTVEPEQPQAPKTHRSTGQSTHI
jgi:serine protease Do